MYPDPEETAKSYKELSVQIRKRLQNLIKSCVCGSGKETVKPMKSYISGRDPEVIPKFDYEFWLGIRKKRKNSIKDL
jgi:hypothetical protein